MKMEPSPGIEPGTSPFTLTSVFGQLIIRGLDCIFSVLYDKSLAALVSRSGPRKECHGLNHRWPLTVIRDSLCDFSQNGQRSVSPWVRSTD